MNAAILFTLVAGVVLAAPVFAIRPLAKMGMSPWVGSVSTLSVSPTSVSLPSSTPNNTVLANPTASWIVNLMALAVSTWTLSVSATTPSCTNAPLNAITVKCTAITDTGIGVVIHACGMPIKLSTASQTLASGTDAILVTAGHRTVSLQVSFADTFQYTATTAPCSVNLTYVLNSI